MLVKNLAGHIKDKHKNRWLELEQDARDKEKKKVFLTLGVDYSPAEKIEESVKKREKKSVEKQSPKICQPKFSKVPEDLTNYENEAIKLRLQMLEKENTTLKSTVSNVLERLVKLENKMGEQPPVASLQINQN